MLAFNPSETLQVIEDERHYVLPRLYVNAFAPFAPIASTSGFMAFPKTGAGQLHAQANGWDSICRHYLQHTCYASTLKFSILNPTSADADSLVTGTNNGDGDWWRAFDTSSAGANNPLPTEWAEPTARTSKISVFKSRRSARETEFGIGAARNNIQSLMFEKDTITTAWGSSGIPLSQATNNNLTRSRMSSYCNNMLIPPTKQRGLRGVKTFDLTGTQETRGGAVMKMTLKELPIRKARFYAKIVRVMGPEAEAVEASREEFIPPFKHMHDKPPNNRVYGCYVIQFDDLAQSAISDWNLIELNLEINYRCLFSGDRYKKTDAAFRYSTAHGADQNQISSLGLDYDYGLAQAPLGTGTGASLLNWSRWLFTSAYDLDADLDSEHHFTFTSHRNFGFAWQTSVSSLVEFQNISDWMQSF